MKVSPTYYRRLNAGKLVADQVTPTVSILPTLDLLAADLLIRGTSKETFWTGADRLVSHSRADGIAATNDRTRTSILTLEQTVVTAYASVLLAAVHVSPTAGLLNAEAVLAGVKQRALR